MRNKQIGPFLSAQQAQGLTASTELGSGAPSSVDDFCGAQQALFNLIRSACIALSSLEHGERFAQDPCRASVLRRDDSVMHPFSFSSSSDNARAAQIGKVT